MTTISELKHQIKVQKLELLSKFLKEKLTRKQELESELREINSELSEFTERYGHFYETVSQDDLDVFLKEEVKPQVKRRKPMSNDTKAKISKAMKLKHQVKSKPISELKARDLNEDVEDLENFRDNMKKLPSIPRWKSNLEDEDEEDDGKFDLGAQGLEGSLSELDKLLSDENFKKTKAS